MSQRVSDEGRGHAMNPVSVCRPAGLQVRGAGETAEGEAGGPVAAESHLRAAAGPAEAAAGAAHAVPADVAVPPLPDAEERSAQCAGCLLVSGGTVGAVPVTWTFLARSPRTPLPSTLRQQDMIVGCSPADVLWSSPVCLQTHTGHRVQLH